MEKISNNTSLSFNCNLKMRSKGRYSSPNNKQEIQDILLSQLHEQYAQNNNANLSSIITLFVTLLAVFGAFGYVFIHSSEKSTGLFELYDTQSNTYSLSALSLTTLATFIVITIMNCICVYQGVWQRKEQFIIDAIRRQYIDKNDFEKIFPSNYKPFDKDYLKPIQGLFGEFVKIFFSLFIVILVGFFIKCSCHFGIIEIVSTISCGCLILINICYIKCQIKKYKDRANEYIDK